MVVNGQCVNRQCVNRQCVNGQWMNGQCVNGQCVNGQWMNGQWVNLKSRIFEQFTIAGIGSLMYLNDMQDDNPLLIKSFEFGVKASSIAYEIKTKYKEFDLSSQLTRSSTSIGANAEESIGAESIKDFYHKLAISYKEARESHYFIRVLTARKMIDERISKELLDEAEELMKIIGSIKRTLKKKYKLGKN